MKILHISGTHGCHRRLRDLPEADVLVHSGDFTMARTEQEAINFLKWLCNLPYAHKIWIHPKEAGLRMGTGQRLGLFAGGRKKSCGDCSSQL